MIPISTRISLVVLFVKSLLLHLALVWEEGSGSHSAHIQMPHLPGHAEGIRSMGLAGRVACVQLQATRDLRDLPSYTPTSLPLH